MIKDNIILNDRLEILFSYHMDPKARIIYLQDNEDKDNVFNAKMVIKSLLFFASQSKDPIILIINSFGGCVYDTLSVADVIKTIPNKVIGLLYGTAQSGASLIYVSCDKRYISENSYLMLHGVQDELEGSYTNIKYEMEQNKMLIKRYCDIYAKNSNHSSVFWRNKLKKDFYVDAKKSLIFGLSHHIIHSKLLGDLLGGNK